MEKGSGYFGLVVSELQFELALGSLMLILASIYPIYQILFHPLAKYPGPLWAKLSITRATYHAWKGDGHLDIWQMHRKYGQIVRYGPNWLLFNTAEGYKDIYGMNRNIGKHRQFSQFNPRASNLFTMHNKKAHRQRRRSIGLAFSDANLKKFEPKLLGHIGKLCDQIYLSQKTNEDRWGSPLNMSDWVAYLTFDTLTDFLFSTNYSLLTSSKERHIIYHIKAHMVRLAVCIYMPILAILKIDKLLLKKATNSTRVFWRWVKNAIAARSKHSTQLQDVFAQIEVSRESELSPTVGIQSETGMFIGAGLDTTVTALCALLFYLGRSQQAYGRICSEIRNTFEDESHIHLGQRLKSCVYLHACIEEALRMSPPIGSPPWRETETGGETIAGHDIPQGCSVGTGIYSMHHNDAYFESPHEFIPERWLLHAERGDDKLYRAAFMPFSTGPRSCIGRTLAYSEILLTTAIMLWKYDFRASIGKDHDLGGGKEVSGKAKVGRANAGEFQLIDWAVGLQEGPVLEFRVRDVSCIEIGS